MNSNDLTLLEIDRILERCPQIPNPFQELAKLHDCDLKAGDLLIVPPWIFQCSCQRHGRDGIFIEDGDLKHDPKRSFTKKGH